ncbi:MAG TPA: M20 family metallopeptidase [Candidatus Wallbacteria bacterium]|nr:M20 family metallopeptidase [Candidatus Wallbacteria bacterium]
MSVEKKTGVKKNTGLYKLAAAHIDSAAGTILNFRRHLHANPELSEEEAETKNYIIANIAKKEYIKLSEFEDTFGFWVDVIFKNDGYASGAAVLRADMDALPVIEETGLDFQSKITAKMHACGHDVHMTALYGALCAVIDNYDAFKNSINLSALRFVFQAAEEKSPGGASLLVKHGVMQNVKMAFGLHVMPNLPSGAAALMEGPVMAAVDEFELEISGRGGHGAKPDEADDLILQASEIISGAQKIISRKTSPFIPAVISFCTFHAGSARNILPARVNLSGTIRSLDSVTREALKVKLEHAIKSSCAEFGTEYNLRLINGYPVTINDKKAVEVFFPACEIVLGKGSVLRESDRSMGSEDFSYYAQKAPSAFVFFGCGEKDPALDYPLHHPRFNVKDADIINAAKIFAALCAEFCG